MMRMKEGDEMEKSIEVSDDDNNNGAGRSGE
jgi:hypothetical protein